MSDQKSHQPIADQPPPIPHETRPTWSAVIDDMLQRNRDGIARYGTPLQPFNGRNNLVDAYQEALDLVVYMRNEIEERRQHPATAVLKQLYTAIEDYIWIVGWPFDPTTKSCRVCGATEGELHDPERVCGVLGAARKAASEFLPR